MTSSSLAVTMFWSALLFLGCIAGSVELALVFIMPRTENELNWFVRWVKMWEVSDTPPNWTRVISTLSRISRISHFFFFLAKSDSRASANPIHVQEERGSGFVATINITSYGLLLPFIASALPIVSNIDNDTSSYSGIGWNTTFLINRYLPIKGAL